jgi:hypothetical protein
MENVIKLFSLSLPRLLLFEFIIILFLFSYKLSSPKMILMKGTGKIFSDGDDDDN